MSTEVVCRHRSWGQLIIILFEMMHHQSQLVSCSNDEILLLERYVQVRRYVYHDVIRLGDLEKLIDCSYIQVLCIYTYIFILLIEES